MAMCRNDATISYFMSLQMAIFCLISSSESQKVLCRYGKYVNLDNLLCKMILPPIPAFNEKWQSNHFHAHIWSLNCMGNLQN